MKIFKKLLVLLLVLVAAVSCDDDINYDDFGVAPIIENTAFETNINHGTKTVTITAKADGSDYFEIDWGDETIIQESTTGVESHTYGAPGNYSITVTARKNGLVNKKTTKVVSVALIANLVITKKINPKKAAEVILGLTATNATNYDIDWGDDSTVENTTEKTITHTYSADGEYKIKVTAKADGFVSESGETSFTVSAGIRFVIDRDFEKGDLGDFLEGFPGASNIVADPVNPDNKVLLYDSQIATGFAATAIPFTEITPKDAVLTVEYSFYPTTIASWSDYVRLTKTARTSDSRIEFQHTSVVDSYRARIADTGTTANINIAPNEWHSVRIIIDPTLGTAVFTVDGDATKAITVSVGDVEVLDSYAFFEYGSSGNNDMYLDNIKVSYIGNAPTTDVIITAINKDFETGNTSEWLGPVAGITNVLSIVEDPLDATNKVLFFDASKTTVNFPAVGVKMDSETPAGKIIKLSYRINTPGNDLTSDYYRLTQKSFAGPGADRNNRVKFQLKGNNSYQANTEKSNVDNIADVAYNVWHIVEVEINPNSNTATYTVDGNEAKSVTVSAKDGELLEKYNYFEFGTRGDNNTYIDDIKVTYVE